jgi:hypothetical protein
MIPFLTDRQYLLFRDLKSEIKVSIQVLWIIYPPFLRKLLFLHAVIKVEVLIHPEFLQLVQ